MHAYTIFLLINNWQKSSLKLLIKLPFYYILNSTVAKIKWVIK